MNTRTKLGTAALAVVFGAGSVASAQGPVREGLRRTGQATANVVQGTAEATGNVIRGTAEATGNVVRGTAEATRNVVGGAARVTRDVVTAPFGGATNDGRYAAGYRGVDSSQAGYVQPGQPGYDASQAQYDAAQHSGVTHRLYVDRQGREYICDNGHRIYVSAQSAQSQAPTEADASQQENQASQATWNQNQAAQHSGVQGATYDSQTPPPAPQLNYGAVQNPDSARSALATESGARQDSVAPGTANPNP